MPMAEGSVAMAESKAAWDQVGQDFRALGRQVRQHYEQQAQAEDRDQGPPPADRRKVDEALQKLTESLEQAFNALGDTIRDPQFGEQTRKAAGSLSDALNATFAEASERFRKK
jgi:hypothetical protein